MFPVSRLTVCRLALLLLLGLAAPLAASERERALERLAHDFAYTFEAGDMAAFAPLATESPVGNPHWLYIRTVFNLQECLQVRGERATILQADDSTALVVVDIQATGRQLTNHKEKPVLSPWTLHLRSDGRQWRIESAAATAKELALAYLAGDKEWSVARVMEPFVAPRDLVYELANWASQKRASNERSIEAIEYSETIALEMHDEAMIAFCDFSKARMAYADKDFVRAVQLGEAAVARARTAGDPDTLGAALFGVAMAETPEHPERALADYTETLEMLPQLYNPRIAIVAGVNLTEIHLSQHDYRGATAMAQRVLALSETYHWPEGACDALIHLGNVHDHLRDFALARQYFDRALVIARTIGGAPDQALALCGIASEDIELGDVSAALEYFREAMKLAARSQGWINAGTRSAYAAALLRLKRYDEAEKLIKDTLEYGRNEREGALVATSLSNLSIIRLQQGRHEEAIRLARQALAQNYEHDLADPQDASAWLLQLALARALRAAGRRQEAIDALRHAVTSIEAERDRLAGAGISTFRFFADKIDAYHELIELLVREKQPAEAFAVAERMRGRTLADALDENPRAGMLTAAERAREASLEARLREINRSLLAARVAGDEARLIALRKELDAARLDLDRFDEESGVIHAAVRTREAAAGAGEALLPEGMSATAVVEYVVGDKSTIVFALRRTGGRPHLTVRVLPVGREALARRIESFCHAVESRDLDYVRAARRLEATLVEPLRPALHGVSTLAIVPDVELWRLPFQALVTPDGRFLIQHFGIFYTPSLSMLSQAHAASRNGSAQPTLLAFGNPVVSSAEAARLRNAGYDGDIHPLPDAEREVHAIAALYGGHSRVYVQGEASENVFKHDAPQYDILHLATHGFLDDHSPMYSALLFAALPGDATEDGLLETREILHMRLHASMAVLAACDTGRGTTGPGEGVIGISWAFLMAGCPTTVVTQWKASSAAASTLMVDFHRHLRNGAGKADALRLAQVAMLHNRTLRHPFYWASFVMVGAP